MTTAAKRQAEKNLWAYTRAGLVLAILGGGIMAVAWPHTTIDTFGNPENHGSRLLTDLGMVLAYAGNLFLFVGLVGWAVKFGREASPTDPAAS